MIIPPSPAYESGVTEISRRHADFINFMAHCAVIWANDEASGVMQQRAVRQLQSRKWYAVFSLEKPVFLGTFSYNGPT